MQDAGCRQGTKSRSVVKREASASVEFTTAKVSCTFTMAFSRDAPAATPTPSDNSDALELHEAKVTKVCAKLHPRLCSESWRSELPHRGCFPTQCCWRLRRRCSNLIHVMKKTHDIFIDVQNMRYTIGLNILKSF